MRRSSVLAPAEGLSFARKVEGVMAPIVSNESYRADRSAMPLPTPKVHEHRRLPGYPVHFPTRSQLFVNARKLPN